MDDIKIVKTQIEAKTRKLQATWTLESQQSYIIDTAMNNLADNIADEIDWEVLCKLNETTENWIEIQFSKDAKNAGKRVIRKWVQQTFKNGVFVFSNRVMFAREEDAVLFALRWS
jgi:hypothetical protein